MLKAPPASPGRDLRAQIAAGTVTLPGVFNAFSALCAQQAGATALYLSGAGLTNANLGVPDIGLATLSEFTDTATKITAVTHLPVISDADTGFGEEWNVSRTVIEMERAGLAGIHLEDQVFPKRCGHLDGKQVIPTEQMLEKIRAAVGSKRDESFLIIARTDARSIEGLEGAIHRAEAYAAAGADAIFPEGLVSEEEFALFRAAIPIPLLANMTEFGKTPLISSNRFAEIGYEMVIFPMTAFRVMHRALDRAYGELLQTGTQAGLIDEMRTRSELYDTLGYAEYGQPTW